MVPRSAANRHATSREVRNHFLLFALCCARVDLRRPQPNSG